MKRGEGDVWGGGEKEEGQQTTPTYPPSSSPPAASPKPQKVQPYIIDVKPDGRVTWRTEVSGMWYTYLALRAFPFDRQRLTVNLALTNFNPTKTFVELVPSTSGTDIFTLGDGDTLSGWDVTDVWVEANPNKTFQSQFVSFRRDRSAPDDPSPLIPAGGGDEGAFGTEIVISSVQVREGRGREREKRGGMFFCGGGGQTRTFQPFSPPLFLCLFRSWSPSSASPSTSCSPSSCPSCL